MTPVLDVEGLRVDRGGARVLDRVSFSLAAGEALGIVGASGAGKSTLVRALLGLVHPASGRIRWSGQDVAAMSALERRAVRRRMQVVFQDPASSLDPRWTVAAIVAEPLTVHRLCDGRARDAEVVRLLEMVELDAGLLPRHPHQLSGGQAQRVALARALATAPSLLIADEALSACDVSLQAQILNLLRDLRESLGLACIFISHDLRLASCLCSRIGVLANGSLVEIADAPGLLREGTHPAARALVAAARRTSCR